MNRNELFKKSIEGHESGSLFQVRNRGNNMFYISMKNGPYPVEGTPYFDSWSEAKTFMRDNWQRLYDEVFEREVLIGSEEHQADSGSEGDSTT